MVEAARYAGTDGWRSGCWRSATVKYRAEVDDTDEEEIPQPATAGAGEDAAEVEANTSRAPPPAGPPYPEEKHGG